MNLKLDQEKLYNLNKQEENKRKKYWKYRVLGTCGTISKGLTRESSESQKKRKKVEQEKYLKK